MNEDDAETVASAAIWHCLSHIQKYARQVAICKRKGWPIDYAGSRPTMPIRVNGVRQTGYGASLLPEERDEIRRRFRQDVPIAVLARDYRRSTFTIRRVVNS